MLELCSLLEASRALPETKEIQTWSLRSLNRSSDPRKTNVVYRNFRIRIPPECARISEGGTWLREKFENEKVRFRFEVLLDS